MFGFRFGKRLATAKKTYDFPPFRPPNEADSLLLRLTRGCPWNQCAFCPMYRDVPFEVRSVEEVLEDIHTAQELYGENVKTVFIGDSNSLVMQTKLLCEILKHLYDAFPGIQRVTSYARAGTLKKKSSDSLRQIHKAGLTRLHIGLETGSRALLKMFKKGATPETMVAGCTKAKEAGFEVSLYVLAGMGGEEMWREHATETAKVINQIAPNFIRVRTLTPQPGTPIYQWLKDGSFEMASPETILREQGRLIEGLSIPCEYLSDHVSNYAPLNGKLPDDKKNLLETVEQTLNRISQDDGFRNDLKNMQYMRRL